MIITDGSNPDPKFREVEWDELNDIIYIRRSDAEVRRLFCVLRCVAENR